MDLVVATSDIFVGWATVALAAATWGLLSAAIWAGYKASRGVRDQINEQRLIERRRRVFELQSVLSRADFIAINAEAVKMMEAFGSDASSARTAWDSLSSFKSLRILAVLNFYELVATEYNEGFLDRGAANKNLAYTVIATWEYAEAFVAYLRDNDPAYFDEWKYLYDNHRQTILDAARERPASRRAGGAPKAQQTGGVAQQAPPIGEEIHLPGPTLLPLLTAGAITTIVIGTTVSIVLSAVGVGLLGVVLIGWIRDTRRDIEALPESSRTDLSHGKH